MVTQWVIDGCVMVHDWFIVVKYGSLFGVMTNNTQQPSAIRGVYPYMRTPLPSQKHFNIQRGTNHLWGHDWFADPIYNWWSWLPRLLAASNHEPPNAYCVTSDFSVNNGNNLVWFLVDQQKRTLSNFFDPGQVRSWLDKKGTPWNVLNQRGVSWSLLNPSISVASW